MKVSECMSVNVHVCSPDDTIMEAARTMREIDAGILPVAENDRMVGMVTDRDIAVRAVADGRGPDTRVESIMSHEVLYVFDDEDLDDVAEQMANLKVRRMPVVNHDKRLVGIISLSDISHADLRDSAKALSEISEPGGMHSQH